MEHQQYSVRRPSQVSASKPFPNAEALPGVLAELAGEGIMFVDVALTKTHSFDRIGLGPATTDYELGGRNSSANASSGGAGSIVPPSS